MSRESLHRVAVSATKSKRFQVIVVILVVLCIFSGLVVVKFEQGALGANISDYGDGLWWSITTMTGVGYGDTYPVSTGGRLVGVFVEVIGVVLFGAIIAMSSIALLRYQEDYYVKRMMERVDGIELKIDTLRKEIEYLVKDRVNGKRSK